MKIATVNLSKLSVWKNACAVFLFCAAAATTSTAQTFTSLVSFDGPDGNEPYYGSLIQGTDGNLYGTTVSGGHSITQAGNGTIFDITLAGSLTTLYTFCTQNCLSGTTPYAGVIQGTDGNFYLTASSGGANEACNGGCGTVLKVTPQGTETTLHSFLASDGDFPKDGLIQASDGNFYGTTSLAGAHCNTLLACGGTVFKITPGGTLTTLYSFCSQLGCPDGDSPYAGLPQASDGNFYGTTASGGASGFGTVFRITPAGKLARLHSFDGTDGSLPVGALVQGLDGSLYGTTVQGGVNSSCFGSTCGTVYKISPTGTFATLYSFCSQANCADGSYPYGGLVQATDGNFYGTTDLGGANSACVSGSGCGTIFKITPAGKLTTLYTFCAQTSCSDGTAPLAGLLQATDGNFYGTTSSGGANITCSGFACGTAFSFSTGLGPFVELQRRSGKVGQTGGILGQGFTGTTAVSFNGTPASFTVISDTYLRATVPPGATSGFVTVNTPGGTLTSNVPFRVTP